MDVEGVADTIGDVRVEAGEVEDDNVALFVDRVTSDGIVAVFDSCVPVNTDDVVCVPVTGFSGNVIAMGVNIFVVYVDISGITIDVACLKLLIKCGRCLSRSPSRRVILSLSL